MRRLLLALLLACLPLSACVDANALTLDEMRVTLAGDSIHVRVPLTVPSDADSARITLTLTPGGSQTVKATPQATAVTFAFLAPAEGATISLKACGIAYKKGVAGPNSCNTAQSYTRPVNPPGPITWPDSMVISALNESKPVGDLAVILTATGETCQAEWRDYHRALLIAPKGTQTASCDSAFHRADHAGQIGYDNLATLAALAAGYPWTATHDSLWRNEVSPWGAT